MMEYLTEDQLKAVQDFLYWLDSTTYYELGKDIQSDYGDGESYFNRIDSEALLKEYKNSINLNA